LRISHDSIEFEAGFSRKGNLQAHLADLPEIAEIDGLFSETFNGKIFPKGPMGR
jgi:hypothetical protein